MSMNSNRFRYALLGASAMVSAAAVASASWAADARAYDFDMPAQPLTLALKTFGATADQQLIFSEALVRDRSAPALKGNYTPDQALAMLLSGSGLIADKTPGGVVTIRSAAADPQSGSAAGGADGTVQALIVTAQKREENIQDVPIAMSAFTQEDLTRSQVAGGPDLMTQVPNFTFTKTNFSSYSIQIRGIGTQAISATTDAAVAVAFNNTPFIRNRFFEQEFYDLERVEVLRGPQGTLYGRNATAGVVNVISAKPTYHFAARLSGDVSNYDSIRLEGMLNLPLVQDKAALRIAGAWTKRDGYVKNILTGQQTDGRDLWSTRVTLGLDPVDKFSAILIYEHFEENDDRLRSGKQLCHKDLGPTEVNGIPVPQFSSGLANFSANYFSQGCKPASLYSPDSFQTPNGYALPYYGPLKELGGPVNQYLDPYLHSTQSRNLREIETHLTPDYEATNDTVEVQLRLDLTPALTLASETGFNRDHLFSFEDYNRFDTTRGVFTPGRDRGRFDIVDENGVFCDPQLGCTDRLALGDLSTARSKQFSQEFRLSSSLQGPVNFSLGANFLRYDTEDKYYVFVNSLTAFAAGGAQQDNPTPWPTDNDFCFSQRNGQNFDMNGYVWSDPFMTASAGGCHYIDPGNIHNLNDQGRNYFFSKNPYHLISYAAFGEVYWKVTEALRLTAGFRWTDDRKAAPQIPSWVLAGMTYGTPSRKLIRQEWSEPTGRFAVDWKPNLPFTDDTLVYASYVHGYKAGGSNPPPTIIGSAPVNLPFGDVTTLLLTHPETFEAEFVNAYETGTKNTMFNGRLTLNVNAFYYDYMGYQISEIVDRSAVNLNFDAKIWGSEIEADWRPLENLRLGFKGGYENTRLADGAKAIDLMDRSAGDPNYIVKRPFPTIPSNCIVAVTNAIDGSCFDYYLINPPADVPNNGEGILKDLSGNALPNAPRFTATITADYTLPLPSDWLVTLHTDLYYQSEAWTRIFNTPGYDKLKAYNNINLAAIFSNEDRGWQVMAYIKNVLDKDNVTGAFLNSDDTGLTTNVFLNEPRLFGLRVTKNWTESEWWSAHANHGGWYPFRLELMGDYGHFTGGHEVLAPHTASLFPAEHPYPLGIQTDLDWGSAGGVKFSYQPNANNWFAMASVRYGRANGAAEGHSKWEFPGGYNLSPESPLVIAYPAALQYIDPKASGYYNYATATASNEESHVIADFAVGKDMGLGAWAHGARSSLEFGLRYAKFKSGSDAVLHGRPDFYFPPENLAKYGGSLHRMHAHLDSGREFQGAGPAVSWDLDFPIHEFGDQAGGLGLDLGLGGAVLWGKQTTWSSGLVTEEDRTAVFQRAIPSLGKYGEQVTTTLTPLDTTRTKRVTVPGVDANLGLTYTLGGLKLSGGYRVERYFDAIDGGLAQRKTYDRQYDGPYFKISVGFGG